MSAQTFAHYFNKYRHAYLLIIIGIIIVISSQISSYFIEWNTVGNVLRFATVIGLLGFGVTLVFLAGGGGIDLSVGSMMSLSAVTIGFIMQGEVNPWIAAASGIVAGVTMGAINGFLITYIRIPPLITTLSTLYAYGGLAVALTNGRPLTGFPAEFGVIGLTDVYGIPLQFIIFLIPAFIILQWMLSHTRFGRHIYAVGDDETTARLLGISVERVRWILYTISGMLAGCSAVIMNSWLLTARPDVGEFRELIAITVAVLGGTSIFGGIGTIYGTILATIAVATLQFGMQLANVNSIWQHGIIGILLIVTVSLNVIGRR